MSTAEIANHIFRQLCDGRGLTQTAIYVAVPGNQTARWLLPAASPEIGKVLASWAPYRIWSRVSWAAIRAASHSGRIAQVPGASVLPVDGTQGVDWESLGWRGVHPPVPVIYLGTPGPRRKAVVHLVDRDSAECTAVVKVPLTDEAKVSVLREAQVLEVLASERYGHSPRLLQADWKRAITTQAFLEGRPAPRKFTPECWRLLQSLLLLGEPTTLAEHVETWSEEIGSETEYSASRYTAAAIDELQDHSPLPACWEHGDFTPWNIRRMPGGGYALLDWEDAQRRGLPLQDAFHFLHMQDWLFDRQPRLHAAEIWDEAIRMGFQCVGENPAVPTGLEPSSHSAEHSACGRALGHPEPHRRDCSPHGLTHRCSPTPVLTHTLQRHQCHQLETAYLVHSYLRCVREHNFERARFLSSTLALSRRKAA